MKKRIQLLGLMLGLVIAPLASCNIITVPPLDENAILVDETVEGYTALGPSTHHVGDQYFGEWQNNFDKNGASVMTATSIADVRSYDNDLASAIVKRGPQAVYTLKGVGVADTKVAGWNTTWGPDRKVSDGHLCIIFGEYYTDIETEVTLINSWIPDPRTCKVDSLTPETYWVSPNFSEIADENGYDWTTNPVITKAGLYNLTLVKYRKPIDGITFGIGATLIEERPEAQPAKLKCWRVIGSIDGWNEREATYIFDESKSCTITTTQTESIKIAKFLSDNSTDWTRSLGYHEATTTTPELIANDGESIKLLVPGTYKLTLSETYDSVNIEKIA